VGEPVNKEELTIDQPVIVTTRSGRSHEKYPGKVVKIARKYVTIEYFWGRDRPATMEFSIETQKEKGSEGWSWGAVFRTMAQQDRVDRESAADEGFRELGLSHRIGTSKLSLEEMEAVVAVVKAMRVCVETREPIDGPNGTEYEWVIRSFPRDAFRAMVGFPQGMKLVSICAPQGYVQITAREVTKED
jgi:hypothetical protein